MRRAFLSLAIAASIFSAPAIAAPFADRLAAFHSSLDATPCSSDSDCEARALSFGIAPDLLDAMTDCENGDTEACEFVDENAN